jgi:hypothetical protein
MTIKNTLLIAISLLLSTNFLSAQKWTRGYLINAKGDTLKGEINYNDWVNVPTYIEFRKDYAHPVDYYKSTDYNGVGIFKPQEIHFVKVPFLRINNELWDYKRMSSYDNPRLINADVPADTFTQFFLLRLVKGKVSLYGYDNVTTNRIHYFIQKGDGQIEELIKRRVRVSNKEVNKIYEVETYRQQLLNALSDCDKMKAGDINKAVYDGETFFRLVEFHNRCSGDFVAVKGVSRKPRHSFWIKAGVSRPFAMISDRYSGGDDNYRIDEQVIAPIIGATYEIQLPHVLRSFRFGIDFQLLMFKSERGRAIPSGQLIYNAQQLSGRFGAYFSHDIKTMRSPFKPFVKAGFGLARHFNSSVTRTFIESSTVTQNLTHAKNEFFMNVGMGLRLSRFSLECQYAYNVNNLNAANSQYIAIYRVNQLGLIAGFAF